MANKVTAAIIAACAFCASMMGIGLVVAVADGPGPRAPVRVGPPPVVPDATAQQGRTGEVLLRNGEVRLNIPQGYYFLPASDARAHIQRSGVATPPGEVLGMIAPASRRATDDAFWGAVVSYNPIGYVAPEGGERLPQPEFLADVRSARPAASPRLEAFAVAPFWDRSANVVSWTERAAAAGPTARSVRQEKRFLGRSAVVGTTIDARPDQAAEIASAGGAIERMISFTSGKAYSSYDARKDPAPVFDIPGLLTLKPRPVAAKVAPANVSGPKAAPQPATSSTPKAVLQPATANPLANLMTWLPWAIFALLVLGLVPWIAGMLRGGGKRPKPVQATPSAAEAAPPPPPAPPEDDPNLTPKS